MLVAGAAAGAAGAVAFAAIHALLIVPIWARLPGGLLQAVPVGIALAWGFDRLARVRGWRGAVDGGVFGLVMFATLVPATVFSNALRLAGRPGADWPATFGVLVIAALSGMSAGWALARERGAALVIMAATLVLTIGSSGPVPVVNSARAAWLFAGFLPICALAGIAAAVARKDIA